MRSHAIQLLYFNAGGGHASAARALAAALASAAPENTIERVNLQDLLDRLDLLQRYAGIRIEDYYNRLIAREWTWGFDWAARLLQAVIAVRRPLIETALADWFHQTQPALVVSLIPHFNPLIAAALARACPATRFVLVLTDLADPVPSFWLAGLERGPDAQPQLVVCGTPRAVDQARAQGIDNGRILPTSGMILRPAFYQPLAKTDRAEARAALGLAPDLPTALVLVGGTGSRSMLDIAARLERVSAPLQAIYLCGRNARLAAELRRTPGHHPRHVEEFTEKVPGFMRLADFFVGKPGPGSLSEALHLGLPAIVVSNARTLPQERYNAEWLEQNGWGVALRRWRDLDAAVERLLRPGVLDAYRLRVGRYHNQAVFEIAEAIAKQLAPSCA